MLLIYVFVKLLIVKKIMMEKVLDENLIKAVINFAAKTTPSFIQGNIMIEIYNKLQDLHFCSFLDPGASSFKIELKP